MWEWMFKSRTDLNQSETGLQGVYLLPYSCDCAESLPFEIVAGWKKSRGSSWLKLPGRLPGRLHELKVATDVLPLDCHLVKQANHFED